MTRRLLPGLLPALALAAPLLLAGCGGDEPAPPTQFPPLTYGYLQPLRLNVGTIEIDDHWVPPPGVPDLSAQSPAVPLDVLRHMAQDRLLAIGNSGKAVFTVEDASIQPVGDSLNGRLQVRLDIFTSDGRRAAYAEATAVGTSTGPEDENAMPAALYALTQRMMTGPTGMNVEFQYQLRHGVGDWLQTGDGPAPPPPAVDQQTLAPPSAPAPGAAGQPTQYRLVPSPPPGS